MRSTLLLMTAVVVLGACAKEEEKEASFAAKDIAGTWVVSCTPAALGQLTAHRTATLTLGADGTYTYQHTSYQDAACTTKFYDETSAGTFKLGEPVDEHGKYVTVTATSGTGVARHEAVVTAFNALNNCGHVDWAIDADIDLVGTPCIGWSESNTTEAVDLAEVGGVLQIQVVSLNGESRQRSAGDDFNKL